MILNEVSRNQLLAQSKQNKRYQKRNKSNILTTANEYNKIDMNKLFKEDIIEANIPVKGETNNYVVTISYEKVLEELKNEIKNNNNKLELRCCVQALQKAFNKQDIYVHCSCPDHAYRFGYWATIKHYEASKPELRPAHKTNPHNAEGSCCKHSLLTLSKTLWLLKTASVLHNYCKYMERVQNNLYKRIMEPKLFDEIPEEKEDNIEQLSFDDSKEIDIEEIDEVKENEEKKDVEEVEMEIDDDEPQ